MMEAWRTGFHLTMARCFGVANLVVGRIEQGKEMIFRGAAEGGGRASHSFSDQDRGQSVSDSFVGSAGHQARVRYLCPMKRLLCFQGHDTTDCSEHCKQEYDVTFHSLSSVPRLRSSLL